MSFLCLSTYSATDDVSYELKTTYTQTKNKNRKIITKIDKKAIFLITKEKL